MTHAHTARTWSLADLGGDEKSVTKHFVAVSTNAKVLAQRIIPELESKAEPNLGHDSSTNILVRRYRKLKETA
jgi:hypothetical protein